MARAIDGVRMLILGSAGIGAFYAAAHLSGSSPNEADAIVAPAARPERPAALAKASINPDPLPASTPRDAPELAASSPAPRPAASAAGRPDRSAAIPGDTGQIFASMSWVVAPPPPKPLAVVAAAPAAPVAPPLPFTFVGLVEKGTPKPQAFLSRGEELLVVSTGDLLDSGNYRVEAVEAGQIVFMHLPTKTKQVINLSGGSQ
jgi:hypothetical protein